MAKEIKFKDDKIFKLVQEKSALLTEARSLTHEIERLEKERQALGYKIQTKKNKIIPMIFKKISKQLGEFEYATKSDISGDDIVVSVSNALEDFKAQYKKENKK